MKPQVLVVDDSLTIRMDLRAALGAAGFLVTACETKALAQKVLESRPFSLVVLDVLLPDGDGIDLLKQIRNSLQLSRVPVILLSTEAEVKDRILGLTFGADEYVGKPYDTGYLVQRARELMSRYGSVPRRRRTLAARGRCWRSTTARPTSRHSRGCSGKTATTSSSPAPARRRSSSSCTRTSTA